MIQRRIPLEGVSETLLIPIYARALESKKEKPALYDSVAVQLIDSLDYDFDKFNRNMAPLWGCVARSIILDRETSLYIADHPDCSVINLGCGLDDRFSRVDNGKLTWYNIDFADVIRLRKQLLPSHNRVIDIASSVMDFNWVDQIDATQDVLVVAEGLLMYLTAEDIQLLFSRIGDSFPHSTLLLDLLAKIAASRRFTNKDVKKMKVDYKWGVRKASDFSVLCPQYATTGDFILTSVMRQFSPIMITLFTPILHFANSRIGRFERRP